MQIVQFAALGVIFCCGLGTTKGSFYAPLRCEISSQSCPIYGQSGLKILLFPECSPNGMEERSFYGRNDAPRYSYRSKPKVTWLFHA